MDNMAEKIKVSECAGTDYRKSGSNVRCSIFDVAADSFRGTVHGHVEQR